MISDIRYDCRHYLGYKPCGHSLLCAKTCAAYEPRGTRILIIKLAAMGDVLRTTPLLYALREAYKPSYVTWLTDPESQILLRYNPLVDRVLSAGLDSALTLQAEHFELLLNFEKEQRALALDTLIAADQKRGFALHAAGTLGVHNAASEYALHLGIDDELKFRLNRKTMPQILSEMAELPYRRDPYILEIGPNAKEFAKAFAVRHNFGAGRKVIGLNTGCGEVFSTKQWPARSFLDLVRRLHGETDTILLLLGGPREREFNAALLREAPKGALIDTGCDNALEEFFGLIETCDLIVTSDSLAMHLGIARKKKVVALMGPTSSAEIDLYDRGELLSAGLDCAPCYRTRCDRAVGCMEALSADRVFEAVLRQLE